LNRFFSSDKKVSSTDDVEPDVEAEAALGADSGFFSVMPSLLDIDCVFAPHGVGFILDYMAIWPVRFPSFLGPTFSFFVGHVLL
jgi:hypothetical protein